VPAAEYVEFRLVTQYGSGAHDGDPADVLNYLRWCSQWERSMAR
jgi:hypothetical protein